MAQTLIWETKHHEEEVSLLNNRVSSLQEELTRVSHEKGNMDGRIVELDQLVGQLLALNESLVAQLSGKPWKALTPSVGTKKIKKVKKSSSVSSVPRVASLATEASKAAAKKVTIQHHKGIEGSDIDQLRSLHKAYAKMASSLTRAVSPLATRSPHRTRKSPITDMAASEMHHSTSSLGTSRGSTRLSRKKKSSSSSGADTHDRQTHSSSRPSTPLSSSATATPSMTTTASVRIPKPAVSFDASQLGGDLHHYHLQDSTDDHPNRSYLSAQQIDVSQLRSPALNNHNNNSNQHNNHSYHTFPTRSSGTNPFTGTTTSSSNSDFQPKEDLKEMISSLEEEFNDLNRQYRRLLSNVSASSTEVPASLSEQSIDDRAQEIVKVIQKLHEKGEQLRVLKSPTK